MKSNYANAQARGRRLRAFWPRWIVTTVALTLVSVAHAQTTDLTFVAGVKLWTHTWTTWGFSTDNSNSTQAITQEPAKGTKLAVIPQLGIRYKDFLVSASGMVKTDYTMNASFGEYTQSRDEQDVNLAYYVLPGLALSVGYKKSTQSIPVNSQSWAGPTLGLSASASLSEGLSMYGLLGVGWLKTESKSAGATTTVNENTDYLLNEVGLTYSFTPPPFIKSATLTFGYRTQLVTTKNIERRSFDTPAAASTFQDGRDLTQGFTVGFVAAF